MQDAGSGIWEGGAGVSAARAASDGGEGVAGKVVEVVSGDTVVVRMADGKDLRVSLARCVHIFFSSFLFFLFLLLTEQCIGARV